MSIKHFVLIPIYSLLLSSCGSSTVEINPELFYAPKIFSESTYFSIVIPVEVEEKYGKKSFVKLFEAYGFSGNGPAIEQIIKRNIGISGLNYDSEADAFVMYAVNIEQQRKILEKLKCVENMACLNSWLENSTSIILKE